MSSIHTLGSTTHFGEGPSEATLREVRRRQDAASVGVLNQKTEQHQCEPDAQSFQSTVEKLDFDYLIKMGTVALSALLLATRAAKDRSFADVGPALQSDIRDLLGFTCLESDMSEFLGNVLKNIGQGNLPGRKVRAILRKLSEACDNEFIARRDKLRRLAKRI